MRSRPVRTLRIFEGHPRWRQAPFKDALQAAVWAGERWSGVRAR